MIRNLQLLQKMNEKNISSKELAEALNIPEKTMINKLRNPSLFTCDQIVAVYKILALTRREAIEIFFPKTAAACGNPKLPENPTKYEQTLIKAWKHDGYSDEQIAEFLEAL